MVVNQGALILAGGGVAGIAWETGVLLGLTETSPEIADMLADVSTRYIGTSAGATVAAQLASSVALPSLYEAQLTGAVPEIAVTIDLREFGAMMAGATVGAADAAEARRRIGAIARGAVTPTPAARRTVICARLPSHEWPTRDLAITAIDTDTGDLRMFDRSSGVGLVDAVAASCAVPGIWPSVEIDGRFYMDGGMRTVSNADLAAGAHRVLILVPGPAEGPLGPVVSAGEIAALGSARVAIVCADTASLAAMGSNPLDPETRAPAARAGRAVGRAAAPEVLAQWTPRSIPRTAPRATLDQ